MLEGAQDFSLEQIAQWLPEHLDPIPLEAVRAAAAEQFQLARRQALLPLMLGDAALTRSGGKPTLTRLTLNICNDCNLWCSDCQTDSDTPHPRKSYMSMERAEQLIEQVLVYYDAVEVVHFFGAEPLMNVQAIHAVGVAFEAAVRMGRLEQMPMFVATTQGTLASAQILETLRRWNVELTINWDSLPENPEDTIEEQQKPPSRKFSTFGRGAGYEKLVENLRSFEEYQIWYGIECSYTAAHVEAGISVCDLMDFFASMTSQHLFHIAPGQIPGAVPMDKLIPLYRNAAAYTVKNIVAGKGPLLSFASSIVEQIVNQRLTYCPAFLHQLSITLNSCAYPCFMFIGDRSFRLGNILTRTFSSYESAIVLKRHFKELGLDPSGSQNWYAPLLSGSVAGEHITTNILGLRNTVPVYEAMIEECLMGVAVRGVAEMNAYGGEFVML